MAEGTKMYKGLALPAFGEYEQTQQTAATDMATLTGASGQSGDFIVCQNNSGSELFVVASTGKITSAAGLQSATMTVTGIGTFDLAAQNAGTATFAVSGLTSNDVVVLSPREDTDGALVVDKVAAGTLQIRNVASEGANVECNYLVISKA